MEEQPRPAEQTPEDQDERKKRPIVLLVLFAAIAAIAASAAFIALPLSQQDPYDAAARNASGAETSYDDMVAELDESAQRSRLWISVASSMRADAETGTARAFDAHGEQVSVLDNRAENIFDIKYTFTLDNGTVIYESSLIRPGQSIESPVLQERLAPGAYDVTVVAQGYDVASHNAVGGTVAAHATLNVE